MLYGAIEQYGARFGSVDNGDVEASSEQRVDFLLQVARDVGVALNAMFATYASVVVAYGAWYMKTHPDPVTYPHLITWHAARLVVLNCMDPERVHWSLVGFPGVEETEGSESE